MSEKPVYKTYTVNLRLDQIEYLKTLSNASEFLRGLIDEAMRKETPAEKVEEKAETKRELSRIEQQLVQSLLDHREHIFDKELEWKDRLRDRRPYRYKKAYFEIHFPLIEEEPFIRYLKEKNQRDLLAYIEKIMAESENETEFRETLKPVYDEATKIWLDRYPEKWRTKITKEYTLGDLIEEIGDTRETTVHEVAGILGLTYQQVYNRIRPILESERYRFVRRKG